MIKETKFCDRCKEVIPKRYFPGNFRIIKYTLIDTSNFADRLDLCPKCEEDLIKWIRMEDKNE